MIVGIVSVARREAFAKETRSASRRFIQDVFHRHFFSSPSRHRQDGVGFTPRRRGSGLRSRNLAGARATFCARALWVDAWRMVQRRAADLGARVRIGCHTFRATGITAYLEAGGTLENAQAMAAHESPRTTKLYDRTGDEITLDEVERIVI